MDRAALFGIATLNRLWYAYPDASAGDRWSGTDAESIRFKATGDQTTIYPLSWTSNRMFS